MVQKSKISIGQDFQKALAKSATAQKRWAKIPPSHQREYAKWINEANKPETRANRIEKAVERLAAEANK